MKHGLDILALNAAIELSRDAASRGQLIAATKSARSVASAAFCKESFTAGPLWWMRAGLLPDHPDADLDTRVFHHLSPRLPSQSVTAPCNLRQPEARLNSAARPPPISVCAPTVISTHWRPLSDHGLIHDVDREQNGQCGWHDNRRNEPLRSCD